jgi:CheY-like chemotaxis protein
MATQGSGYTIKVTPNLVGAEQLIDAAKFAVAFVDVGLDADDDGNVDGLRVMEKIRATGDDAGRAHGWTGCAQGGRGSLQVG